MPTSSNRSNGRSPSTPGPKPTPKLDLSVKGATGLPVYGGRVQYEYLMDLDGARGRKILREMSEQDPIVSGILLGVEMLARQVPWGVKPADVEDDSDKDKAQEVADFIDGCLTDMNPSWIDTLSEILSMLPFGWSWFEILYKRRQGLNDDDPAKNSRYEDGKVGWRGWSIRGQESLDTWEFEFPLGDDNGSLGRLLGMWQMAAPTYKRVFVPRAKSLHFRAMSREENPEGRSFLRGAYRPWYMKKNIEVIEGIGVERDLAGLPVLWAPAELFSDDAEIEQKALFAKLRDIVTNIKRDEQEGILMPMAYDEDGKNPLYKLELLSTGGDRQFDTSAIINRYDERIAMSMMADFILMGHESVGSYALSSTKTGLFSTALASLLDLITAEINMSAIPKLVRLNGYALKFVPTLTHGKVDSADMAKIGAYLQALSNAGMAIFPNKPLEEFLLETAGLPSDPDMLGAGNFPLPGPDANDPGAPPQMIPAPGGAFGGGRPTPSATGKKPIVPKPTSARSPSPSTPTPRAAAEPKRPKRFIPLITRFGRLEQQLEESLEPQAFQDLMKAVFSQRKFSWLDEAHQQLILDAEATADAP